MPRGLSPVSLHSHAPHAQSYSALVLDSFNPWPEDSAKRPYLRDGGPLLPDLVEDLPEPCAKRQRLGAPQMPIAPLKPQARWAQPVETEAQEVKRRRLEPCGGAEVEEMMDSAEAPQAHAETDDSQLEEPGQELALIPAEVSSKASRRSAASVFGLSSHCPASILSCIRDAFSSPSWEPSLKHIPPLSHRPWLNDNEDALENLIVFKGGKSTSSEQQMNLWSRPTAPLHFDQDVEEPSLPGLVIFSDHFRENSANRFPTPAPSPRIEEIVEDQPSRIEEIEEVPMEQ